MLCPLTFSLAIATALLSSIGRRVRISRGRGTGQGKQHDGRREGGAAGFDADLLESLGVKEVPVARRVAGKEARQPESVVCLANLLACSFACSSTRLVGRRCLFLGLGSAAVGSDLELARGCRAAWHGFNQSVPKSHSPSPRLQHVASLSRPMGAKPLGA